MKSVACIILLPQLDYWDAVNHIILTIGNGSMEERRPSQANVRHVYLRRTYYVRPIYLRGTYFFKFKSFQKLQNITMTYS